MSKAERIASCIECGCPFDEDETAAELRRLAQVEREYLALKASIGEPVAWLHKMDNTEGIKGNDQYCAISFSRKNPFGRPGIDYSKSYPVTSNPLYAIKDNQP